MRDGSVKAVQVEVHPDPRVDAILRQVRDAEIAQGVDRVRPMFCAAPRVVFILGKVVADVTVDAVVSWSEFKAMGRIWRALAAGPLPLSQAGAVAMHPDIWTKGSASRDAVLNSIIKDMRGIIAGQTWPPHSLNEIPIWGMGWARSQPLSLCRYRPLGETGRHGGRRTDQFALVAAGPADARESLGAFIGPLASFEVVCELHRKPAQGAPRGREPLPDDLAEEAASFWEADGVSPREAARRARVQWEQERAPRPAKPQAKPPPIPKTAPKRATGP